MVFMYESKVNLIFASKNKSVALGLFYDRTSVITPAVVAKATGDEAAELLEVGKQQGVYILYDDIAYDLVWNNNVGKPLHKEDFRIVASAYAKMYDEEEE